MRRQGHVYWEMRSSGFEVGAHRWGGQPPRKGPSPPGCSCHVAGSQPCNPGRTAGDTAAGSQKMGSYCPALSGFAHPGGSHPPQPESVQGTPRGGAVRGAAAPCPRAWAAWEPCPPAAARVLAVAPGDLEPGPPHWQLPPPWAAEAGEVSGAHTQGSRSTARGSEQVVYQSALPPGPAPQTRCAKTSADTDGHRCRGGRRTDWAGQLPEGRP